MTAGGAEGAVCGEGAAGADGAVCATVAAVCGDGAVYYYGRCVRWSAERAVARNKKLIQNHCFSEDDRL